MKLLIIDDEPDVRLLLREFLEEADHTCLEAPDAEEARERLRENEGQLDAILLDLKLPGRSGMELLDELRALGDDTPVLFVTGNEAVEDRVLGLRKGADDYLTKPFSPEELLARVEAVVRRRHSLPTLQVGDLSVELGRRVVKRKGERIDVSPREYDLLLELVAADGRVRSRAELLHKVWGIDQDTGTNVVEVQIARLRRKLDRDHAPMIRTVPGEGYQLVPATEHPSERAG